MSREEVSKNFEQRFAELKRKFCIKADIEELDKEFFIKDIVKREGYVSSNLLRFINRRMIDHLGSWNNYLHSLVVPNPNSMFSISESQMFSDDEKQKIMALSTKIMVNTSENNINLLLITDNEEAKSIDKNLRFWKDVKKEILKIIKVVHDGWARKLKEEETGKPLKQSC